MRTPLAFHNLIHEKLRTVVAATGVAFALTLVFMQVGFLQSVSHTATLVLGQLDFDVAIVSTDYQQFAQAGKFPLIRLREAMVIPEVSRATPLYVGVQAWRCDQPALKVVKNRLILMLGFPTYTRPFLRPDQEPPNARFPISISDRALARLNRVDTVLLDQQSNESFEPQEPGSWAEVGGRRVQVVGDFSLGSGFASDGTILVSDRTFSRLLGGFPLSNVSLGLVKLRPPTDPLSQAELEARRQSVANRITLMTGRNRRPAPFGEVRSNIRVLTHEQLLREETNYWIWKKSIGLIFLFGVAVAIIVGLVVVYQVLSSDIVDHLREYATLKAMGYSSAYLKRVVILQATLLAILGYIPALGVGFVLYSVTRQAAHLPIVMTWTIAVLVLGISLAMCISAAVFSVRKVSSSDPATLF